MSWPASADRVLRRTQRAFSAGPVVYTPPSGPPVTLTESPFREAHQAPQPDGTVVHIDAPSLSVVLADLPGGDAEENALVELADGRRFRVASRERDGEGGALLVLAEVAT